MTADETYVVAASLHLNGVPGDATFTSPTTIETVEGMQCKVEAELTGGNFDITPTGRRPQSFSDTDALTWEWDVVPEDGGAGQHLTLTLMSRQVGDGYELPLREHRFAAAIVVDAAPKPPRERIRDMVDHPFGAALLSAALLGLCKLAWTRWRQHGRLPVEALRR